MAYALGGAIWTRRKGSRRLYDLGKANLALE